MARIDTSVLRHLLASESVALLTHVNPDWDCLGSSLALREALRENGVRCDVFVDEPLSPRLSVWDTGVIVYGDFSGYACLCCVDVGDPSRVGRMGDALSAHTDTACIDHHLGGGGFAAVSYVDAASPATGEIIFDMLESAGIDISKRTAEYLYCAIASDTGSFRYCGTTAHTMRAAARLMELGADATALCDALFGRKTLRELKMEGEAIANLKLYADGKVGVSSISAAEYEKHGANKNDTEALASLPRDIDGVVAGAFLTERSPGEIRVNLRSRAGCSVQPVAARFGGGGHAYAAGCTLKGVTMDEAVRLIASELEKAAGTGRSYGESYGI